MYNAFDDPGHDLDQRAKAGPPDVVHLMTYLEVEVLLHQGNLSQINLQAPLM